MQRSCEPFGGKFGRAIIQIFAFEDAEHQHFAW
jgi:hypothetical protein